MLLWFQHGHECWNEEHDNHIIAFLLLQYTQPCFSIGCYTYVWSSYSKYEWQLVVTDWDCLINAFVPLPFHQFWATNGLALKKCVLSRTSISYQWQRLGQFSHISNLKVHSFLMQRLKAYPTYFESRMSLTALAAWEGRWQLVPQQGI